MTDEPTADKPETGTTRWLTIDEACRLLGVDQSTLRRWSDSGEVPVFRTPGGHRRYNEEDLRAIIRGERRPRQRLSSQMLADRSMSAYVPEYIRQAHQRPWYRAYSAEQIDELRALGRRLVDLAVRSINQRGNQDAILDEGRTIGRRYGTLSARAGLSATDAVEAFLFFRYPVFQAVMRAIEEQGQTPRRAARIYRDMSHFLDQVLIATVAAHADEP